MPGHLRGLTRLTLSTTTALALLYGSQAAAVQALPAPPADPESAVSITKTNNTGGDPLEPGEEFIYTLTGQCSGLTVDCVDFTVTDTLPEGLDVTSLPQSTSSRDVTYDESTRLLTVVYKQPLQNPSGKTGLRAGQAGSIEIGMRLPADTDLTEGTVITNTAEVKADNATPKSADTDVTVTIPRVVKPVATKTWKDGSAVAGSREESTVTLNVRNNSSSSAEVTELSVSDTSEETFEYFNFRSATVTAFPKGADQAHLVVTTADGATHTGPDITSPGRLPLPDGVEPGQVTGFEVVFTNSKGDPLPYDETGGTVEVGLELRETKRSDGSPLRPTDKITVNNCATPAVEEKTEGEVKGDSTCAPYDILPDILVLQPTKRFYPDTNGNFSQETGEHAVLGENSPVSTEVDVKNASPFPVKTLTITEPSADTTSEFDKLDVDKVRLRFPEGATEARLTVTYDDGSTDTFASPYTANATVDVAKAGKKVTKVEVTYTGVDADGNPTIAEGSTAGLDLHGTLTGDVTAEDLSTGTSPGVDNCAAYKGDAGRTDGSGTASGDACKNLPIEAPNTSGSGTKDASQHEIPADQPITMNLKVTNNGNKPLVRPVVTDPAAGPDGSPASTSPFDVLQITSVSVSPSDAPVKIELWDPSAGGGSGAWVAYDPSNAELMERATGVRGTYQGELAPQSGFTMTVVAERRPGVPDGTTLQNCYSIDAGGDYTPGAPVCGPSMDTAAASDSASLNKSISPGSLPEYVPGLPRQHADMRLTIANTGNMSAKTLRMTDRDTDFFDAVDLVSIKSNQMPAGANRVQIDAYVDGKWVNGTPSSSAALPAGVNAADVTGIRVTYSSTSTTNDGYVIKPECASSSCSGILVLDVSPRQSLRSSGDPVPSHLEDTVSGSFLTKLQAPDRPKAIDPVDATLDLVKGTPRITIGKTPNTVLAPGEDAPFYIKVTNTGTANIPDLVVKDALPEGIQFVDTFEGDNGEPYKVIDTAVPAGTPAVPTPDFTQTTSGDRTSGLTWDFSKDKDGKPWAFAPGATLTIEIHVKLEPGIDAGDVVTNKAGATSSDPDLACEGSSERDGAFGSGLYCTATATLTAKSGAAFAARKWVAGNDSLGWYNTRDKKTVPAGDSSCLSTTDAAGRRYTANPCIALVNPGDEYHYLMRIQNAGTEAGTAMRIVERFPVQGDKGVILDQARGTAWDKRPTLASEPQLDGPGTMTTSYENTEPLCTDDLNMGGAGSSEPQCPSTTWDDAYSAQAVGARFDLKFAPAMAPGETVNITWAMDTPLDVKKNGDPTIAWNSYAHNETTDRAGSPRVLQPNEPIQVGVALAYGDLKLVKRIGDSPKALDPVLARVPFPFHVTCVIHPQGGLPRKVVDEDYDVSANKPVTITGIPAGAECEVYETSARGGQATHTKENPAEVTIKPGFGTTTVETGRVTNAFRFGALKLVKEVDGDAASYAKDRSFDVRVTCALPDAAGNPTTQIVRKKYTVTADTPVVIKPLPVNSRCWAAEVDTGGADTAVVDHGTPRTAVTITEDSAGQATITATNTFDAAKLVVRKKVIGEDEAGSYSFTLACTTAEGDVALAPGDRTFVLPAGGEHEVTVPKGAHCKVTETDIPAEATVSYSPKGGETDVNGTATLTVTNKFPPAPDPDGHDKDDKDGKGHEDGELAHTGPGNWAALGGLFTSLLVAGGVLWWVAARRGRTAA
ncbi:DUF5979 domain-containing protein [Streptomyces indicus]|uniref:Conserved repeat domain-containing protein/fimbrial isopeptide formation D2 domain-containing protein n=1 Tax=Streptomyces indicus TaxID=417292 RepID=A0A1G9GB80_9ACTN|nr:DUF5979 domain-containing protein [Streptomyces indicus]SDK97994.1 conserved repeat domain-containing protein/fimbrial isopeptide formation D2 domain-containing protein [Streptomyces indicus]